MRLSIGYILGMLSVIFIVIYSRYTLNRYDWQCTAARVVKDTLPKVEECVEYTRKDAPDAP